VKDRPSERPVDRCVCHDVTFAELVRLQRESGATFLEIVERTNATTGCGLCYWYVRAALASGETRFAVLADEALERITENGKGPASGDAGP